MTMTRGSKKSRSKSAVADNTRAVYVKKAPVCHKEGYDYLLLISVIVLMCLGIVMVYSASSMVAMKRFGSDMYFFGKQIIWVLLAILTIVCCRYIPYLLYRKLVYLILALAFIMLITLAIPGIAEPIGGAKRWFTFFGMSFQPSEYAKLALIVYMAYSMSKKGEDMSKFNIGFVPHVMVLSLLVIPILLQPDFGMAVILVLIAGIMLFVGGSSLSHLFASVAITIPIAYLVLVNEGYRLARLKALWDPWQYEADAGYQIVHSLLAFGSGGLFGAGIGNGYQKLFYLPESHTDFVLSVVGEELGLVGVLAILLLYVVILWRGAIIAMNGKDKFATFLATGLTVALGIQACVNAGVVMQLLPTKGLPLPFVSYGGSSLLINAIAVGILMNIWSQREVATR